MFGAFIAALLSAKVINVNLGDGGQLNAWLYVVIGFLSGFSERFSRGFIRIAEERLGTGGGTEPPRVNVNTRETVVAGAQPMVRQGGAPRPD
jgi:hypothetical protein